MPEIESSPTLYKVISSDDWRAAETQGEFTGVGIDLDDGFIHLSSQSQVVETVGRYFAGQEGLLLVAVDASKLGDTLRWEPSRNGDLFPHVYGSISMEAVIRTDKLPVNRDGSHRFPF